MEKKLKLRALTDHVILRRDRPEEVSKGGIVIPEKARDYRQEVGTVVSVGPGRRAETTGELIPIDPGITVGARVVFPGFAGQDFTVDFVDEEPFLVVNAQDIMAAIEEESADD